MATLEMQPDCCVSLAESMDSRLESQILGQGFLELLSRSSRVSVRLSNAIRFAAEQKKLPYQTVEAYLEAGELGRFRMMQVGSIGRKSIAELDLLIAEAGLYQSMLDAPSDGGSSTSLVEIGFSELFTSFCGVNTHLVKAVLSAESKNAFPYRTVGAYLRAGKAGRSQMLQVEGFDQDLLIELDLLLSDAGYVCHDKAFADGDYPICEAHPQGAGSAESAGHELSGEEVLGLPLDEFVAKQRAVSTRLLNAISMAVSTGTCPFETIADYLRCGSRQDELRKIENLGRGSAIEFERLVARSIRSKAEASIRQNDHGYVDVGSIVKEALSLLTSRQQEVIVERFLEKKTLEAVASARGITRERVRQIEAKSLKVLSTKFGSVLLESANAICSRLHENGLFELSIEDFSKLVTCEVGEAVVYLALLKKFDVDQTTFGAFEGNVFVRSHYVPRKAWKATLTEELRSQPLPLVLDGILSSISSVPGFYIRDYFQRRWGAQTDGSSAAVPAYGTSRMCIDVLRKAGGPLHTSDVRARIYALFQVDIEEHAINAMLGRLGETVITAPGTYALYESLPYAPAQIESIRNIAHSHLLAKGVFLSSKILFDQAFASRLDEFPGCLNHYLVMGIVQDDERFTTKRGNMVGLVTFDLTEAYTPLQDEIRRIVLDHGPIDLPEIAERLSDTRRLCNDSGIRLVLSQSPEVIRVGKRTFDSLHRFFDTRQAYDDLLLAIRISLLQKKKTTYAITHDLGRIQLKKLTSHLIESMLLSMDDVRSEDDIHELVNTNDDLTEYNDVVVRTLQEQGTIEDVQTSLCSTISTERLTKLISLDTRFLIDSASSSTVADDTELASILRDFDF